MTVNELRTEMQAAFRDVQTKFEHVDAEFKNVRGEMRTLRAELLAAMKAEGETTRRHFDVVAEQFRDFTKVLADGIARNTKRLDDHEQRIRGIERSGW